MRLLVRLVLFWLISLGCIESQEIHENTVEVNHATINKVKTCKIKYEKAVSSLFVHSVNPIMVNISSDRTNSEHRSKRYLLCDLQCC